MKKLIMFLLVIYFVLCLTAIEQPDDLRNLWLSHSKDEVAVNGIGPTGGTAGISMVHRFTQEQLDDLGVMGGLLYIVSFQVFRAGVSFAEIRVWTGGTITPQIHPGTLLHTQAVPLPYTPQKWIDVELTNPVPIQGGELWFGVHLVLNQLAAGRDSGPNDAGYGDLTWTTTGNTWTTLPGLNPSFTYNWMVRGLAGDANGTLIGLVQSDGNPISGATVTLETTPPRVTTTNNVGEYQISILPVGTYTGTATRFGYLPATETNIVITATDTNTRNFTMTLAPQVLVSGRIIASDTNQPVLGAMAMLTGPAAYETVAVDIEGYFAISGVTINADYLLTLSAPDYEPNALTITVGEVNLEMGDLFVWEKTNPARNVTATLVGSAVNLSWQEPTPITGRDFETYTIYRTNIIDLDDSASWEILATNIPSTGVWNSYLDETWAGVHSGAFRYVVCAVYTNGNISAPAMSNALDKFPPDMIMVGNPQSTSFVRYPPFNFYWGTSLTQSIYRAEEINSGGSIEELVYWFRSMGDIPEKKPVAIYLANVPTSFHVHPSNFFTNISFDQFTKVYEGPLHVNQPAGEHTLFIKLDTPFLYEGANLVVYAHRILDGRGNYNLNNMFKFTNHPGEIRTLLTWSSSEIYDFYNPPTHELNIDANGNMANLGLMINSQITGSVSGVVTIDGDPVDEVFLEIDGLVRSTKTNTQGEYFFPYIIEGNYTLTATKIGLDDFFSEPFTIVGGENTSFDINLNHSETISVSGRIVAYDTGLPFLAATITLTGYTSFPPVISDGDGLFVINGVFVHRTYQINVSAPGYLNTIFSIETSSIDLNIGDIMLTEIASPPSNVQIEIAPDNSAVTVSWLPPPVETSGYASNHQHGLRHTIVRLNETRAFESYSIYRTLDTNTSDPELWTLLAENITDLEYTDHDWQFLSTGKYRYAVRSVYTNHHTSAATLSNIANRLHTGDIYLGDPESNAFYYFSFVHYLYRKGIIQTIFLSEEINHTGLIEELVYEFQGSGGLAENIEHKIWMAEVDRVTFTSTTDWVPFSAFTEVFSGNLPVAVNGHHEITIKLDQPFDYQCASLVIMAQKFDADPVADNMWRTTDAGTFRVLWVATDSITEYDPASLPAGARRDLRANMLLKFHRITTGDLTGKVYTSNTETPLEGVEVRLIDTDHITFTDSKGYYCLENIQQGVYTFEATKNGYEVYTQTGIRIIAEDTTVHNITLDEKKEYALVTIHLITNNEQPISDALVRLENPEQLYEQNVSSETVIFEAVLYGIYTLSVKHQDYHDFFLPELAINEEQIIIDVELETLNVLDLVDVPSETALIANYPNPFNPSTNIMFHLASASNISIDIYNIKGQRVRNLVNEYYLAGKHQKIWDGKDNQGREASNGVYFYQMKADDYTALRKMVLIK